MSYVNHKKLQNCFDSLWMLIADRQAGSHEEITFRKGFLDDEEGYKHRLLTKAECILRAFQWDSPQIIGSGKIITLALDLLGICPSENGKVQNLVDYRDVDVFIKLSPKKQDEVERLLFHLFNSDQDDLVFKALVQVLGGKYALISYFFFLKDSAKYQVVRPDNFAERLSLIDAPINCVKKCSWENYEIYNAILKEVQSFLSDCLNDEVTLTDAHSFIWMFWLFKDYGRPECNLPANEDGNCTTVIVSAKEGRKVLYYTSKYERNPKLRAEAVRLHGYSCAACGFNFEERYGELGKDFIEVHHTKPLYSLDGETEVNPETDLIPLCSNCHRMIHRKRNAVLTVADLRTVMVSAKGK